MNANYYIGLISGTSMDSIDAALIHIDENTIKLIAKHHQIIPSPIKSLLLEVISGHCHLKQLGELDSQLGHCFAEAAVNCLAKTDLSVQAIKAIGSHGQNIYHQPDANEPFSLQIANPNIIAAKTGITTVADFRRGDMAMGGQGAPLAPLIHEPLFRNNRTDRIIINIGGISNITCLPKEYSQSISGFDTGPGNALIDAWIQQTQQQAYDNKGEWAASGTINEPLLQALLNDPYFKRSAPKSTGKETFNLSWLQQFDLGDSTVDVQTTLVELTAITIAQAIRDTQLIDSEIIICGGGVHNLYLMQRIKAQLKEFDVKSSSELNIDPDAIEAMLFAWLAAHAINHQTIDLSTITGATAPTILGAIYPSL